MANATTNPGKGQFLLLVVMMGVLVNILSIGMSSKVTRAVTLDRELEMNAPIDKVASKVLQGDAGSTKSMQHMGGISTVVNEKNNMGDNMTNNTSTTVRKEDSSQTATISRIDETIISRKEDENPPQLKNRQIVQKTESLSSVGNKEVVSSHGAQSKEIADESTQTEATYPEYLLEDRVRGR